MKVGSHLWKQRILEVWKGCYYVFDLLCYDCYVSTKKNPNSKKIILIVSYVNRSQIKPWSSIIKRSFAFVMINRSPPTGHHHRWLPVVDPAVRPCMTSTPTPTSFQRAFSKDLYGPIPRCLGGDSPHEQSPFLLGRDSKKIKTNSIGLYYMFIFFRSKKINATPNLSNNNKKRISFFPCLSPLCPHPNKTKKQRTPPKKRIFSKPKHPSPTDLLRRQPETDTTNQPFSLQGAIGRLAGRKLSHLPWRIGTSGRFPRFPPSESFRLGCVFFSSRWWWGGGEGKVEWKTSLFGKKRDVGVWLKCEGKKGYDMMFGWIFEVVFHFFERCLDQNNWTCR